MDPVQARSYRFELEQIDEVPVPPILEEIVEVMDEPVLQTQEGLVEVIQRTVIPVPQVLDVPVLQIQEGIVEVIQFINVSVPQDVKIIPLERISERITEQTVDVPVPRPWKRSSRW